MLRRIQGLEIIRTNLRSIQKEEDQSLIYREPKCEECGSSRNDDFDGATPKISFIDDQNFFSEQTTFLVSEEYFERQDDDYSVCKACRVHIILRDSAANIKAVIEDLEF
uniref:Uncharacterized protein n=1 Tax=Romanomermis culicivorax TaxID=13658 RepID=A0A915IQM9_ROMCU